MLFNAGAHVPVIPLLEVVGNGAKELPEQIEGKGVKVGVIPEETVSVVTMILSQPLTEASVS